MDRQLCERHLCVCGAQQQCQELVLLLKAKIGDFPRSGLGFDAFTAEARVQSLVREVRDPASPMVLVGRGERRGWEVWTVSV